jgi:predicted permease
METIGRLRPGVSPAAAQAELEAIARARAATQPKDDYDPSAKLVPAAGTGFGVDAESQAAVARPARVLSVLVGLVLGIACANAAGLLLARGERRRAEIALRLCLGASRRRVVGQLVVEGVTLAVAAAVAGFGVAALLLGFLSRFAEGLPLPIGDLDPFAEPRVLLFAAALALVCGVAFSLAPATHVVAPVAARLAAALRGADRAGRARWSGRGLLIVGQVALSTALLIGSLLLVRSLRAAARFDLGFEPRGAAIATVDLATQGYKSDRGRRAWDEILASVRSTPGVAEAAIGKSVPVQSSGMRATMKPEGYVFAPGESEHVNYNIVSPQYFATLRHPLLSGREFSSEDRRDGAGVAIVNRAFAERFWGKTENAASWLGRRVADIGPGLGAEIVGVVENAAQRSVREAPAPALYVPLAQSYMSGMTIVARAAPGFDAAALPAAIGRAVARFDPNLPVFRTRTLEEHLGVTLAQERASAALFGTFALLAIGLVASGLYSLVAFTTLRRWREIGLRVALGARERQVLALALREAAILAGSGATLGVLLALGLGRALESQLFGVGPTDPPSLLVAALLLIAVALAAGFGPARRAARMNPSAALRSE